ncbi:DNA mismatch repair protein MutS [Mollicutes bacterium LVI A0078]|nr:DNA mismatch repair protein MutS [Mollicutes bacterium LVI A0075]WOO90454.1 DNA mismatch repair protein MutS [Mollicutes bacterium LVI A0078]
MEIKSIDPNQLSAAMRQYYDIKMENFDCIIFFQLGDFYELFFDDAVEISNLLELTLTGKKAGLEERIPMAGIPIKALDEYLKILMKHNKKVAIVDQDDTITPGSKLVTRRLKTIITPGTYHDTNTKDNVFVASLVNEITPKLSYVDIATAECFNCELLNIEEAINEVIRLGIKELVVNFALNEDYLDMLEFYGITVTKHEYRQELIATNNIIQNPKMANVNNLLIDFLDANHIRYDHLINFILIESNDYMRLTLATQKQLELTETMKSSEYVGSLFWYLNDTKTAMGRRLLKQWITRPLVNLGEISKRHHFTEQMIRNSLATDGVKDILSEIYDFERIIGRINDNVIAPKEMYQLLKSIRRLEELKNVLNSYGDDQLSNFASDIDPLVDIYQMLEEAIDENNQMSATNGDIIKPGFNQEVDRLRDVKNNSTKWLANFELEQREQTGIKNLKVKYNKVFGYFLEVSNGNKDLVPEHYVRKQTMTNAERFITNELKDAENEILNAAEMITKLEYDLYVELRTKLKAELSRLKSVAVAISTLDVLGSFASVALKNRLIKPEFTDSNVIEIIEGRHPIVEQMCDNYIVNDCIMDQTNNTLLITGPNMAGKSTYMRQVVLIAIMAQIGCYVPATKAKLKVFDQIFTRIGASDDLAQGQSTFMVEMSETSYALKHATNDSLIIFDELGRGTSTYDGIALAHAIIEYLEKNLDVKTLFSTHYHELTKLEAENSSIKNVHVKAEEESDNGLTFYHKVIPGAVQKSYGIEVAALAKLPVDVIYRSKQLMSTLEASATDVSSVPAETISQELITQNEKLEAELNNLKSLLNVDVNNMTPMEALMTLSKIKQETSNE